MNELVQSIRADLASRRLAPLLALFVLGLLGAFAYVALGGSGTAKPPATIAQTPLPSGLPVAVAPPNATAAASETPAGLRYQTHDPARNPFEPLVKTSPQSAGASSGGSSPNSSTGGSGAGGKAGSSPAGGGESTVPAAKAPAPARPKSQSKPTLTPRPLAVYSVSAMFGPAPSPGQQPALTPYEDMKQFEPLRADKAILLVFLGVAKTGDRAVFALTVPPILRGPATCYPSATQCQAIELLAGQSEELEYTTTSGQSVAFELQVIKISKRAATAATAHRVSKAGRLALLRAGLSSLR